jgi:translation initiation factor IF-1
MSNGKDFLEIEGLVEQSANGKFLVRADDGHLVVCSLSGKIRMAQVKIIVGDRVKMQISPYDLKNGRITFRLK